MCCHLPFPEEQLGEVTVASPGIKIPGYAMAAPAAVMVENNSDFICLLGGDVSAVEHMGTPVSPLSLLLPCPAARPSLAHSAVPRLGGTQSPCTAPSRTPGTIPAGSGFHGFPNPLLPLQHSLPVYCSGLSRKEKLEERKGSQPGHAPENCIFRINSYPQQHQAPPKGIGRCSAHVTEHWLLLLLKDRDGAGSSCQHSQTLVTLQHFRVGSCGWMW